MLLVLQGFICRYLNGTVGPDAGFVRWQLQLRFSSFLSPQVPLLAG